MKLLYVILYLLVKLTVPNVVAQDSQCGCKSLRPCYSSMLQTLTYPQETRCISYAAMGTSTVHVYLRAIAQYCSEFVKLTKDDVTKGFKDLNVVTITKNANAPVILVDAGQGADTDSVRFAMYLIERLLACQEYDYMIEKVNWVILPSTNPDGLEIKRSAPFHWSKNANGESEIVFGVDITRNFDSEWNMCPKAGKMSQEYPGEAPNSETESSFITRIVKKYLPSIRAYLSLRENGHGIYYRNSHNHDSNVGNETIVAAQKIAYAINLKQKISLFRTTFMYSDIYQANGRIPACGSSVAYVAGQGVKLSYEMRVYNGDNNKLVSKVKELPASMVDDISKAYLAGVKALYDHIVA